MDSIVINLDETLCAPTIEKTLLALLVDGKGPWGKGATSVTQESDGALMFWCAPIEEVRKARVEVNGEGELMPLLGMGQQVDCLYYEIDGQEVTAKDWESAVVTLDEFMELLGQ